MTVVLAAPNEPMDNIIMKNDKNIISGQFYANVKNKGRQYLDGCTQPYLNIKNHTSHFSYIYSISPLSNSSLLHSI